MVLVFTSEFPYNVAHAITQHVCQAVADPRAHQHYRSVPLSSPPLDQPAACGSSLEMKLKS